MIKVQQQQDVIQTKKTVDWMIHNTSVSVFNPVDFTGYQRKIDVIHCMKIVDYLIDKGFFLPGAIICACDGDFTENGKLRIVDGQHRVEAFRIMKDRYPQKYLKISLMEVPVIVLADADTQIEIDTFITINKTSKKVDTSLAYVLKNKLNQENVSDINIPQAEYLSVEVAHNLNQDMKHDEWYQKILYEGSIKNRSELISLNAFVKATKPLMTILQKKKLLNFSWKNKSDVDACVHQATGIMQMIWSQIYDKWPELNNDSNVSNEIIQGAIGYTAINKMLVQMIREENQESIKSIDQLLSLTQRWFECMSVSYKKWEKGGEYSKYTSGSGYKLIADELVNSISK